MRILILLVLFFFSLVFAGCTDEATPSILPVPTVAKEHSIDASQKFQTIDGFGVNITPAQWRNENLIATIDSLVDDLGSTLVRFDCYGRADCLDPIMQEADGSYPDEYLEKVYTSPVFKDAWATFRYFKAKGIPATMSKIQSLRFRFYSQESLHLIVASFKFYNDVLRLAAGEHEIRIQRMLQ